MFLSEPMPMLKTHRSPVSIRADVKPRKKTNDAGAFKHRTISQLINDVKPEIVALQKNQVAKGRLKMWWWHFFTF